MQKMKIKNISKSLFITGLAAFVLTGCNDTLDITPPDKISPESYLWSESQLADYTITRYERFIRSISGTGGAGLYLDDAATDVLTNRGGNARFIPGEWKVAEKNSTDDNNIDGQWKFDNIFQINYFLETVTPRYEAGRITGNSTNIAHYIGEGYFLRAWEYYKKLRDFGDFPIITKILPDQKEALVEASKRSPRNEVARFIIQDLDKAIELLTNTPNGGTNRINKDLAYLVKSRVALFEATWLKYHKGTALVPNGQGWPGAEKDYNKNYQFPTGSIDGEINYFLEQAMSASKIVADAHPLTTNSKVIKESPSDPANPYYEMFSSEDLSKYGEVLLWRDFNITLGVVQYWNHYMYYGNGYGYTRQYVDGALMDNGLPIYASGSGYKGDDFVGDVIENRDWRIKLFMRAPGETKAFLNLTPGASPEIEPVVPNIDAGGRYMEGTGYSVKKGLSYDNNMQSVVGRDVTGVVIFRAAEAYLNYIEASYEKNGSIDATASNYWKQIRNRAGVSNDFNKTITATDMNKEAANDWAAYSHGALIDATLYNIRRERKYELAIEGLRYTDLIRWRAMDQLKDYKIEGIKIWGPMADIYNANTESPRLKYGGTNPTASSPTSSKYLRVHQISSNNQYYNGYSFTEAHYLNPIAAANFLIASPDGKSPEASPIYQNPGWGLEGGTPPIGYK